MTSFDRLKSDRERIADCIAFHSWGCDFTCTEHGEAAIRAADAVLAALGDRLLTFPEWVHSVDVYRHEGAFNVNLIEFDESGYDLRGTFGTGPTISAAIRAALESKP